MNALARRETTRLGGEFAGWSIKASRFGVVMYIYYFDNNGYIRECSRRI